MVNQTAVSCEEQHNGVKITFDIDAAITELLDNKGQHSLEFPSTLTAEQRNEAKAVAGQYPELKCESYGFGQDRRLHVFKRSAATCIRVKNTFVDGWAAEDGDEKPNDAIIFRSEPGNLWERASLRAVYNGGDGKLVLPPLLTKPTAPAVPEGRNDPAVPPGHFDTFALGSLVVIKGLVRAPAFNGRVGVVHSLDAESGRYDVLLASSESGRQWAKVKYENLRSAHGPTNHATSAAA